MSSYYTKEQFFRALHQVESKGQLNPPDGDKGRAIGPLQIWEVYWKDSGIQESYQSVRKFEIAKKCVNRFMKRYAENEWGPTMTIDQVEKCARIHNGGPRGHLKPETDDYWERFKEALENLDDEEVVVVEENDNNDDDQDDNEEESKDHRELLKIGMSGADVEEIQQQLADLGYDLGSYGADGKFGKATQQAVMKFQQDHDLAVDGIVGKETRKALNLEKGEDDQEQQEVADDQQEDDDEQQQQQNKDQPQEQDEEETTNEVKEEEQNDDEHEDPQEEEEQQQEDEQEDPQEEQQEDEDQQEDNDEENDQQQEDDDDQEQQQEEEEQEDPQEEEEQQNDDDDQQDDMEEQQDGDDDNDDDDA
ncbi:hypothetical protein FDP41_008870 [Naegleria fowleri]|uniref:lysozyme n=1 Tax=Naegleria fowleri TaxID=5763 RepID=A0A6A5BDE0_NAEFO|nr:uncharacterized protein FDP41_008870 [Naegleria fowleri]KAF0972621.1 hypothetical protein FDP41_008870 [Naegleria fowleri]CAG4718636.1 unnamed protein product [Naegleria fowleri]